jgi:dihydroflavonol-4-reductase
MPTNAFLTGATGFVGWHLLRELQVRGDRVRCLVRDPRQQAQLGKSPVDIAVGDLRDLDSLRRGMRGADVVFHCAADYRLYVPDPQAMYATNVEGTHNVLQAAAECGVRKIVYTSTVGALGRTVDDRPADETTPASLGEMTGHYKRSKFLAQQVARRWAAEGLPVVIVNPSAPVGERDVKPTATGQMILDFMRGRIRAYVDTGLNLIDVRDVAIGHVLAAERGRVGETYILGHRNLTLRRILETLAGIVGVASPRIKLPHWVPLTAAAVDTQWARLRGRHPRLSLDAVRLSRYKMFFNAGKAVRELGLPQSPIESALERAVSWFRDARYVTKAVAS